jgi:hypothetical protein
MRRGVVVLVARGGCGRTIQGQRANSHGLVSHSSHAVHTTTSSLEKIAYGNFFATLHGCRRQKSVVFAACAACHTD